MLVVLHFVVVLHLSFFFIHIFLFDVIPHPSVDYRRVFTLILYFQPSPSHSDSRHFHFSTIPLVIFLPRALRSWVGIFYPQAFFTLCSFTSILTCVYQGLPGSRQFFFEACRASYRSSKHWTDPESSHLERFSFKLLLPNIIMNCLWCAYLLSTRFEPLSLVESHM